MRRVILFSAALWAVASPMQAASRFYCAVNDDNIKLAIDAGFAEEPGHKLNHFRGAMVTKAADAPAAFKTLIIDSSQLGQNWSHDGDLRLELSAHGQGEDGNKSFELLLMASGKDEAAPMAGTYALSFYVSPDVSDGSQDKVTSQYKGRLTCNTK